MAEQIEAKEKATPKKKVAAIKKVEPMMYIGPTFKRDGITQFSTFINGLPKALTEHIEKCPEINVLIVPLADLVAARGRLSTVGSVEHTIYTKVVNYINGGE